MSDRRWRAPGEPGEPELSPVVAPGPWKAPGGEEVRTVDPTGPMRVLEVNLDQPNPELDLPARAVRNDIARPLRPTTAAVGMRWEPSRRSGRVPVAQLYSPVLFAIVALMAAFFLVIGIINLPFVSDLLGIRIRYLALLRSVTSVFVGVWLGAVAIRYRRTHGEDESDHRLTVGAQLAIGLGIVALVFIAGALRGNAAPDGEAAPILYQPAFRRAWLEQLKVAYSNATIEATAEPGQDPAAAGATLHFRTDDCTQQFADGFGDDPASRILLRKAGFGQVACTNGDGTQSYAKPLGQPARD